MVRGVIPAVAKPTREPSDVQRLDQELAGIWGRTRSSVPRASPPMRRPALVSEWTRLVPTASTGAGSWSPVPPAGWGARPPPSSQGHWWPRPTRPLAPNANTAGSQRQYPVAPKAPNTHSIRDPTRDTALCGLDHACRQCSGVRVLLQQWEYWRMTFASKVTFRRIVTTSERVS